MIVRLGLVLLVVLLANVNRGCSQSFPRRIKSLLLHGVLLFVVAVAPIVLSGCGGLVSGAGTTGNPPQPSALTITNVQSLSATTSTSQIVWATNVPADSAVDYGTSTSYGSSTPVDSGMVTSHQITVSGLAASTTYYYQVRSSDSKNNHGNSGGHTFKTSGFSIAGAINPATGGSGATLTLSGAASTTTTADSLGNYTFTGLANGTYTVAPSHAGYTFTPNSQSAAVNGANVTGVNFTDNAAPVAPSITTQPTSQTVTAGQTATFSVAATGTTPLSYQWNRNGTAMSGATSSTYTTPTATTSDSGSTFRVVVTNTAGTVTSAAATLTVNPALVSIAVTPANPSITKGTTQQFTATGTFSDSSTQGLSNVVWASGTATVATISNTGLAATVGTGTSTISATVGSISGATLLTVTPATLVSIAVTPANPSITKGATQQFTATGRFSDSSTQGLSNAVWASGTATVATISNTGLATTVGTGTSTISATVGSITGSTLLTVNPAPTPGIQVSPTSINFGNDVVGGTLSQVLIITNTGAATLSITQVTETGSAFFTVNGFSLPLNVNAGQQTAITVAFLPTSVGSAFGSISIVSNAPTSPTSVGLSGTGIAATFTLGISPTSLSFGNVTTGTSSATKNVNITNAGNSNVTISQITLSGAGYTMTGGSAPVTLTPSQNITLSVQFSPNVAGTVNGNISIVSNAIGSPASVSLSGTGVAQHSAALTWNASTSTVSGYNVYRSTVSGTGYTKLNSSLVSGLTYTDSTVQNGTTYFYVATAVDSGGTESAYSNEMQAVIP